MSIRYGGSSTWIPALMKLDWQQTRWAPSACADAALSVEVYEVKLDDEFLMSSLFTVAETEMP